MVVDVLASRCITLSFTMRRKTIGTEPHWLELILPTSGGHGYEAAFAA